MGVIQVDLWRVEGKQGPPGQAATIRIGTVTAGDTPQVINTGSPTNAILNFVLPSSASGQQEQTVEGISGQKSERSAPEQNMTAQQETERESAFEKKALQMVTALEGILEQCEPQPIGEDVQNLLECFRPMKGVDEKGITHYGFLAGKAEQNLRATGQDPEKTGLIRYEHQNGLAQRWISCEELLALTAEAVLALGKRMTEWEEEGKV